MRSRKSSDSPSDATRDVYPLRGRPQSRGGDLNSVGARVLARAARLLKEQPHLVGEDPYTLMSRIAVRPMAVTYERALLDAALAVLLVAAVDRAESMDVTSGDAA